MEVLDVEWTQADLALDRKAKETEDCSFQHTAELKVLRKGTMCNSRKLWDV